MERVVGSGQRREYAAAVADLWDGVAAPLVRLERIADAPAESIADGASDELPSLQYALHAGAELALGIPPPVGSEALHAELLAALAHGRDATADVVAAIDEGERELLEGLLPEWRGALFRVRLARLRALERTPLRLPDDGEGGTRHHQLPASTLSPAAVAATALIVAGALLFTAGAVLAAWPLWAAGLALFAGGFVLFRP